MVKLRKLYRVGKLNGSLARHTLGLCGYVNTWRVTAREALEAVAWGTPLARLRRDRRAALNVCSVGRGPARPAQEVLRWRV